MQEMQETQEMWVQFLGQKDHLEEEMARDSLTAPHWVHSLLNPCQSRHKQGSWKKTQEPIGTADTFIFS